ncbi:peptide ABC transporter substrate-binding protein [Aerococcus urinaeequi]|uniref:Peptide ABC transporter substrate-binding protein n=1 Tax=Aerococcus viridans TaxID=1377 RepID=A0A2N6UBJ6_9LACT|nr:MULTISPECIES: peptide ABC transporter substrate-binding protein [Aerococcus]OFU53077.1 peptide ABC transporter substrate-binding protein [Aerococcus sp. HMSC10H05]PMC78937.1 peptide ABC transporter substrate-binding protein [Aerococcus viridans]
MERKSLLKSLAVIGLSGLVLAACGNGSDNSGSNGSGESEQVLSWTTSSELPTMDTTMVTDTVSFDMMNNVNEGLYRQNQDGEYEAGVLDGEPEISEDGTVYTYKIKEDATWSNGDPVTANDFVFAWQRLVDPDTAAPYSYLADGIIQNATEIISGEMEPSELGAVAVDEKTLEVSYAKPVPYLEGLLSMAPFYPLNQTYVEEQGDSYATNSDTVLYNGPFTLSGWDGTNLNWSLEKNDSYWDADNVQLDTVKYQVLKETSTALNLFDSGEIDYTTVSGEYVAAREGDPNMANSPESSVFFIKMNQERNGEETPLANTNIRRGIAQAIDKQSFADQVLQNGSLPADYLVPEGLASNPSTDVDFREDSSEGTGFVDYDVESAQEAFNAGLEELGTDAITLELLVDDTENAKRSAEYIQGQLQTNLPGLQVQIVSVPFKNRVAADNSQDYDLQISGWGADYADPINYLELFVTDGNNNNSGYSNEEYDALIQSASDETEDLDKRWNDLVKAETLILDEAGIAPLYQRYGAYLEQPSVEGVVHHQVGASTSFKWASKTAE